MLFDLLATALGIAVVLLGGYLLVQSAVVIALRYGMSRAVVGATVVAFGTSAPELVVGVSAVVRGSDGVTVGNIIGACVGNVGLVLGLAAILNPTVLFTRLRRTAVPVLMGATGLFLLVATGGQIARWEGARCWSDSWGRRWRPRASFLSSVARPTSPRIDPTSAGRPRSGTGRSWRGASSPSLREPNSR